jgi:hypothetical protein
MKKPTTYFALLLLVALFASCKDGETYAEQKNKERKAIDAFIQRDIVVRDEDGTVVCNVGKVNPISEEQFLNQDSTTDLSKNEYVLFSNSGIYMQIVRKGVGEKLEPGKTARIICRFVEFNILGDSIQLRNDVYFWHSSPDIMKISNNYGSFAANFDTESNGGGAMYNKYYKLCNKLYVTKIDAVLGADTFIANFDEDPNFEVASESEPITENGFTFKFVVYKRK